MLRNIQVLLFIVMSLMLSMLFGGCGSSNKEGVPASNVPTVSETTCIVCHSSTIDQYSHTPIVPDYLGSPHDNAFAGCQGCHGGGAEHNGVGPIPFPNPAAAGICVNCHVDKAPAGAPANASTEVVSAFTTNCAHCHNFHLGQTPNLATGNCIGCHDVHAPQHGPNLVGDNDGVRAVVTEFTKWSHHVTGVTLQNAHCAACHLEGNAVNGAIVVDETYHMANNKVHLRDTTKNIDEEFAWDPAAPDHSGMDRFCMSCHDANGAVSTASTAIRAIMVPAPGKTASALNPFGDTISNRYDKMQRPAVVNVFRQFSTSNNSHHGVKGPRYSGRTRAAGPRQIDNPAAFAANSSATLWGKRSTIYDSVNAITGDSEFGTNPAFNALYVPLENSGGEAAPRTGAQSLGDDSTLHCGDCHTVGQWKPGTAKQFNPTSPTTENAGFVSPAIGAHGSNNEYLLRNSRGTDERHTQAAYVKNADGTVTYQNPNAAHLVCYNCHAFNRYGSVYNATGTTGPHAGEYDAEGRCNGIGNTLPFNGYTTGTATDGTQFVSRLEGPISRYASTPAFAPGFPLNEANRPATGEKDPDFANIFGIQCLNCHNSGVGNGYGGIHGSANNSPGTANTAAAGGYANPDPSVLGGAYVDGMGNTQKVERFLPGLGNVMHVPGTLGGFTTVGNVAGPITNSTFVYTFITGAISKDSNWEQVAWTQVAGQPVTVTARAGAGCYTLNSEGEGGSHDNPLSPTYGIKGQSVDGGATTPNMFGTWGACDDHQGSGVGGGDHGFVKRINRPITY
jgi:hypothetical protein